MSSGIYVALSGAIARQQQLEVVGHNLANVSTNGYQAQRIVFRDLLADASPDARQVDVAEVRIDSTQGAHQQTGNELDLAISGQGWFAVGDADQPMLTRDGAFRLNDNHELVTRDGLTVLGQDGPIVLSPDEGEVTIDGQGNVFTEFGGEQRLRVLQPQDPTQLASIGNGYATTDPGNLMPAEDASVAQGFLESSNSSPLRGMTEMITLQRYFETMQNLVQKHHDLDSRASSSVGGSR